MEQSKKQFLEQKANDIRIGIIEGVYNAGCGHPGGSLSIADIMAYLYFEKMNDLECVLYLISSSFQF